MATMNGIWANTDRTIIKGVWFYYNAGEDPDLHLPVAVQRDFHDTEFDKFVQETVSDLTKHGSEELFSDIMQKTRIMLNNVQYQKARNLITRAVADFGNSIEKANILSDEEVLEAEQKAKALRSFTQSPQISLTERQQFHYDANAAERQAAEARKENEELTAALKAQQEQIDKLFKLLEDKDDKEQ